MATFYNQATLSFTGGSIRSNITSSEIPETVSVMKTPVSASYAPGGSVVYAVSIINSGDTAAQGLAVTDDLGGYTSGEATVYPLSYKTGSVKYYVNGVLQAAPAVTSGPPLAISGISVPAGGSAVLIYEADVTAYAPFGADAAIVNTVTVTGGPIVTPAEASATVPASDAPELSIMKTADTSLLGTEGTLSYSFIISNSGGAADAAEEIALGDTFDPVLDGIAVTLDGAAFTNYTYDEATGVFATDAGAITVPAAVWAQNADGTWSFTPGSAVLTVTGTV